jgi:hypothetical protein
MVPQNFMPPPNFETLPMFSEPNLYSHDLTLLETYVEGKFYKSDAALKDKTYELIERLQKAPLSSGEQKLFQKIHALFLQQTSNPQTIEKMDEEKSTLEVRKSPGVQLCTVKIPKDAKSGIQKLFHIVKKWQKAAAVRHLKAKEQNVDKKILCQIADSRIALEGISRDLNDIEHIKCSFYIAYTPEDNTVQAICEIDEKNPEKASLLATNPKNIAIFKDDKPSRGGATALLAHITKEIHSSEKLKNQSLKIVSLSSAIEFYKKFGFEEVPIKKDARKEDSPDATSADYPMKPHLKKSNTSTCGFEGDDDNKMEIQDSDFQENCICERLDDDTEEAADSVIMAFPKKAQDALLLKVKDVQFNKKPYWKLLKSGV